MLSLNDRVDVDLHRVRARIRLLGQTGLEPEAVSSLHELCDAEVLPGWYEDWVIFEQSRLRQDRLRAFTTVSRQSLARGDAETAAAAAEAALELEPLYENAVALLIASELQQGRPAAALRSYERYRDKLEDDMGLLPSASIRGFVADALESRAGATKEQLGPVRGSWLRSQPLLNHS